MDEEEAAFGLGYDFVEGGCEVLEEVGVSCRGDVHAHGEDEGDVFVEGVRGWVGSHCAC